MGDDSLTFVNPMNPSTRRRLEDLHGRLLHLHKVLLDDERVAYEKRYGRVPSSGQMLNLVMFDQWFDWLHRISEMVVQIDELLENDEATVEDAYKIFASARGMLKAPAEDDFGRRYRACLQREPGAVLAHAEVQKVLFTDS